MENKFGPLCALLYLGGALMQAAAILGAFEDGIGLHWLLAVPAMMVATFVPMVSTVLCVWGAVVSFHWVWWQGFLLSFPQLIVLPIGLLGQLVDGRDQARVRRQRFPR